MADLQESYLIEADLRGADLRDCLIDIWTNFKDWLEITGTKNCTKKKFSYKNYMRTLY